MTQSLFQTATVLDGSAKLANTPDTPMMLINSQAVKKFMLDKAFSKVMTQFGSTYKKAPTFKVEKKYHAILPPKNGGSSCHSFFMEMLGDMAPRVIDIDHAAWMNACWCSAFDTSFVQNAFPPNSAAMMRVLFVGEMDVYMTAVEPFEKACHEVAIPVPDKQSLHDAFENLDDATVKKLNAKGAKIFKVSQKAEQLLYVPVGWLVSERAVKGPLIYGIRKSVFVASPAGKASYSKAKIFLESSGVDVSKMISILDKEDWAKTA